MTTIGANTVGIGRIAAYALAALDIDVVQRSTIRSLLPEGTTRPNGAMKAATRRAKGETGGSQNRITVQFGLRLKAFDERGWISREDILIRILNRPELMNCALGRETDVPPPLLRVDETIQEIKREIDAKNRSIAHELVEQRLCELQALSRLMQGPVAGVHLPRTRAVRIVHKPRLP